MKNFILCLVVVFITSLSMAEAADPDREIGLYTKEQFVMQPLENIGKILERFERETPEKNITFYIHGRGRHVEEEWSVLNRLEANHGTRVVMFHWPSWQSLLARPVKNAKESADELAEVFRLIRQYKDDHPDSLTTVKLSLMVHSMGHVVLREFTEKYYDHSLNNSDGQPLFENLVSVAADVGLMDHKPWFISMDYFNKKFVLMNNRDLMLTLSYMLDLKEKNPFHYKLGLGFDRVPITKKKLFQKVDSDTTYIDLSRSLKTDHRYFESTKPFMMTILKPLLNGGEFAIESLGERVVNDRNIFFVTD